MVQPTNRRLVTEDDFTIFTDSFVRFTDLNGDPISGKIVTIVVDTDTNLVEDIIVEDI